MYSWVDYYGARDFVVSVRRREDLDWSDLDLASVLGVGPEELVYSGLGTCWVEVASPDLSPDTRWFSHGDPWSALIGFKGGRAVVGQPRMTETMMAGPHRLEAHHLTAPIALRHGRIAARLVDAVGLTQRSARRAQWTCPLCQSKRYQRGCRCFAIDTGVCID